MPAMSTSCLLEMATVKLMNGQTSNLEAASHAIQSVAHKNKAGSLEQMITNGNQSKRALLGRSLWKRSELRLYIWAQNDDRLPQVEYGSTFVRSKL